MWGSQCFSTPAQDDTPDSPTTPVYDKSAPASIIAVFNQLPAEYTNISVVFVTRSEISASVLSAHLNVPMISNSHHTLMDICQLLLVWPTGSIVATETCLLGDVASGLRVDFSAFNRPFVAIEPLITKNIIPLTCQLPCLVSPALPLVMLQVDVPQKRTPVLAGSRVPTWPCRVAELIRPGSFSLGVGNPDILFSALAAGFLRPPDGSVIGRYKRIYIFVNAGGLMSGCHGAKALQGFVKGNSATTIVTLIFTDEVDLARLIDQLAVAELSGESACLGDSDTAFFERVRSVVARSGKNAWEAVDELKRSRTQTDRPKDPEVEGRRKGLIPRPVEVKPDATNTFIRYVRIHAPPENFLDSLESLPSKRIPVLRPLPRLSISGFRKSRQDTKRRVESESSGDSLGSLLPQF